MLGLVVGVGFQPIQSIPPPAVPGDERRVEASPGSDVADSSVPVVTTARRAEPDRVVGAPLILGVLSSALTSIPGAAWAAVLLLATVLVAWSAAPVAARGPPAPSLVLG